MIAQYLGFDSDFIIIGLAVIVLILMILVIVNIVQMRKLKKNYNIFMSGKNAKSLEEVIKTRLSQVDSLLEANELNEKNINLLFRNMKLAYQKMGLVKYDAFQEMGGKLSFSLALLNQDNTGILISSMHSREGCYTYTKEIIKGESFVLLADEEREALNQAMQKDVI